MILRFNISKMVNYKAIPVLRFNGFTDNWVKQRLGEIAIITTGNTPSTSVSDYYNGSRLFVSPADIQENRYVSKTKTTLTELGFKQGRKISKGSILFVCIGSTIGKVGQASEDCLTNQQINSLEAIKEVSNDFIYGLLEKYGKKIKLLAGVQAVPQINKTDFSNFKYYFPSLPEQQKIATFLSAIDEKIQQLTRKKELLEQYKKGVMQQLFYGKLRFKQESGKTYPKWEEKRLGEIGNTFNGLSGKTKENFGVGEPYIQYMQIFANSKIDISKCGLVQIDKNEEQQRVQYGDVFFTTSSETPNEIGTCSVLLNEVGEMYLNSFCFGFRPNSFEQLVPSFASYLFRNEIFRRIIVRLAQGSTRYNMSKVQLLKLKVLLPSKEEQQKIANYVSSIDAKIESVVNQIEQTQIFKKGLLQQMFV